MSMLILRMMIFLKIFLMFKFNKYKNISENKESFITLLSI